MTVSKVRVRSFTVPKGSRFVCMPLDGAGPLIAEAGCQVTVTVGETWEQTVDAIRLLREEAAKDE